MTKHFLPIPALKGRTSANAAFQMAYTTFAAKDQGKPKRPLIILHGYGENGPINFERIATLAAQAGHEVSVIDWPGHGASDKICDIPFYAETSHDYTAAALEFFAFIQKKYPDGIDILAHSMGGAIFFDALGSSAGQSYQKMIHQMILSAPMFALRGMGYVSEVLYASALGRKMLSFMARHHRTPKPFNFPLKDLTENPDEQKEILKRQKEQTSDCWANSESDWILAANEMMTNVAAQTADCWKNFKGQAHLWASPGDKITDGLRSITIFKKLLPQGIVHKTNLPHRIHTHPEVIREMIKLIG